MSLGHHGLTMSWSNKLGHARKEEGAGGMNEHADHHKEHQKNYGICNPLFDMLFNTRCNSDYAEYGLWKVAKKEQVDKIVFEWEENASVGSKAGDAVSKLYQKSSMGEDLLDIAKDVFLSLRAKAWIPVVA